MLLRKTDKFFIPQQLYCALQVLRTSFQAVCIGLSRTYPVPDHEPDYEAVQQQFYTKLLAQDQLRLLIAEVSVRVRRHFIGTTLMFLILLSGATSCAEDNAPLPLIRVGIIGLDTSHVLHFTTALNVQVPSSELSGCRVVAAYPQGSPDIETSVSRVPEYTKQLRGMGVEIVDSIDALLGRVDAVLLETNDGRPHLEQALPVIKARKRMFIDKPMAASLADVILMFDAAEHYKVPIFSSSALRFAKDTQAVQKGAIGDVLACDVYSPCALEQTHPDFSWYGIHGVEALISVMGAECKTVTRAHTEQQDVAVGIWEGGRIGTYRGMRHGTQLFGGIAFGTKGNQPMGSLRMSPV